MIDIALGFVGLWLLFVVLHHELRRREFELAGVHHRERTREAERRARAFRLDLEGGRARSNRFPQSDREPTPAEVATMVAPSPVDGPSASSEPHPGATGAAGSPPSAAS